MIVPVTGSRSWTDPYVIHDTLDALHKRDKVFTLIHGGATGADAMADQWSEFNSKVNVRRFPVTPEHWTKYGKSAGIKRNIYMVNLMPDIVLGFIRNNSPGASQCVEYAKSKNIRTYAFRQDYPVIA